MNYQGSEMKKFTIITFVKFPLFLLIFCLTNYGVADGEGIPDLDIEMPPSHTALSGDLHIQIVSSSYPPLILQLSRLDGTIVQAQMKISIQPDTLKRNSGLIKIPCGYFSRGGQYYVQIKKKEMEVVGRNTTAIPVKSTTLTRSLDVRWPMPQLTLTPEQIETFPERPVKAILEFPEVVCPPVAGSAPSAIPEFWMELHYCGHSLVTCDNIELSMGNRSSPQVLLSEQVRGFPGSRVFTLPCELFGLAGHYVLLLKPTNPTPALPHTAAYVKADWSKQFVFNVHARSIFPCDVHGDGITVLFEYPACILSGDVVRLFARLRANVASLAPPTTLEYVSEKKVTRGQHSLHFECDLFTERYVEYCFVYVSKAFSGAMADVRMDCVPTLPVTDEERGGWGPWSPWTTCSSTCIGGIRSRYRICDSPPPRYGAKFCEGAAVETEKCGLSSENSWECFYGNSISVSDLAAEIPEVQTEVGPYCRCGCVVHLGKAKPKRLLATSSQSCPGRTFWLIQADADCTVQFKVEQFHLSCGNQWLKVRDGSSLSSNLLADFSGEPDSTPSLVNSTGSNLLLEFYTDEVPVGGNICGGGFFAHASQLKKATPTNGTVISEAQSMSLVRAVILKLTAVHIAVIFFLSGLIVATALLGAQYLFRYRKYHVAQAEDQDSLADPSASSTSLPLTTRASSNATLLSEVISLTRLSRPLQHIKSGRNKHSRLRESMDCEDQGRDEEQATLAKEEDSLSASTATLTAQNETATPTAPQPVTTSCSLPTSPKLEEHVAAIRSPSSVSEKDQSNEKDDVQLDRKEIMRRLSNVSTATLTNVSDLRETCSKSDPGCYSSAASMISTATIRSTNAKATKDKRNREKLLAGPTGSEFSIGPDVDLEMDYYDYNVINAGAAPGSYLGMDPAFLVWIPPLDESGEILPEDGSECHEMEDIRPKVFVDPGSNQESPEEQQTLLPKVLIRGNNSTEDTPKSSPILRKHTRVHPLTVRGGTEENIDNRYLSEVEPLVHNRTVAIQLHEYPKRLRTSPKCTRKDMEKETKVEKSPSVESNVLDEIRFADDDDDEHEELDLTENECNINLPYQDSNILSSS